MDVWTIGEKLKQTNAELETLLDRIKHIESYLSKLTKDNDEAVPGKEDKSPSVRTRRSATKKSKSSK